MPFDKTYFDPCTLACVVFLQSLLFYFTLHMYTYM